MTEHTPETRADIYGFTWTRRADGLWESAVGTLRPDPRFTWNEEEK